MASSRPPKPLWPLGPAEPRASIWLGVLVVASVAIDLIGHVRLRRERLWAILICRALVARSRRDLPRYSACYSQTLIRALATAIDGRQ